MAAAAEGGRNNGVGRPGVSIPKQEDEDVPVGPMGPIEEVNGSGSHSEGKIPPIPSPGPGGSRRRRGRRKYSDILYTEAEGDGDLDRCSSSDG